MKHKIREYKHFGRCLVMDNGATECVCSLDFGPRILSFRLMGHENVFYEQPKDAQYLCSEEGWRVYGGTRFWFAPESVHNVYYPDNAPVEYEFTENGAVLRQAEDTYLKAKKTVKVGFAGEKAELNVEYEIENCGEKALTGAPWIVSMMRGGSELTIPFTCSGFTAKPERNISLWNGTSLADPRFKAYYDRLVIKQKPMDEYFKLGVLSRAGRAECRAGDQLFTKEFDREGENYPDGNVNLEVYTCRWMTEFETLGKLSAVLPAESARHGEKWTLCNIGGIKEKE